MVGKRVLVIDDNEADFDLVCEVLPDSLIPTWVECAEDARASLENHCYDLILLDHGLPDTTGLAFLGELMSEYPECPVIMLTGREDPSLALSALQMGARSYLVKNEIFDHLVLAAEEALNMPLSADPVDSDRFLDKAARFYPRLLETISDGCLVLDRVGIVTFANRAGQNFASFQPGSLLGRDVLDLFTDETRQEMRAELEQAQNSRIPLSSVFQARIGDDASSTPVRISLHTLHAEDGAHENSILIVNDLTEQVRARELRDDLARSMVHDLRTPLTAIVSAVELLAHMHKRDVQTGELLELIDLNLGNMLGLINQILEIERLEHGTLPLSICETSLEALVRQTVRAQSHLAASEQVTLECRINIASTTLRFDPDLIGRVLQNLLANAIRHSPAGETVTVEVVQEFREQEFREPVARMAQEFEEPTAEFAKVRVSVRDRGSGISAELADRLFEKFVRGRGGGSGLGLTFCKFAVEAHGGDIWFDSAPGKGTTFHFTLPSSDLSKPD